MKAITVFFSTMPTHTRYQGSTEQPCKAVQGNIIRACPKVDFPTDEAIQLISLQRLKNERGLANSDSDVLIIQDT